MAAFRRGAMWRWEPKDVKREGALRVGGSASVASQSHDPAVRAVLSLPDADQEQALVAQQRCCPVARSGPREVVSVGVSEDRPGIAGPTVAFEDVVEMPRQLPRSRDALRSGGRADHSAPRNGFGLLHERGERLLRTERCSRLHEHHYDDRAE